MERKEIPNYSWLKFSKPLFYFFCMVTLLKILIARIATSFQKLLSLLIYTSCISWLKDNTIGKFRVGQLTIDALLHPTQSLESSSLWNTGDFTFGQSFI